MKKPKEKAPFNKSQLRSSIRRVWLWSELRKQALSLARIERGKYKCIKCSSIVGPKEVDVNHKQAVTPATGLNSPEEWGIFIGRLLFCRIDGLEVLCKSCHKKETQRERNDKKRKKTII